MGKLPLKKHLKKLGPSPTIIAMLYIATHCRERDKLLEEFQKRILIDDVELCAHVDQLCEGEN